MKFRGLKPIVSETNAWREISEAIRDLFQGLGKLSFGDNFECIEFENIRISAGSRYSFPNRLKFIPTRWIITGNSAGMGISDEGKANWNNQEVSLKNIGSSETIISVVFMR